MTQILITFPEGRLTRLWSDGVHRRWDGPVTIQRRFDDRRRLARFCHLLDLFGLEWRAIGPVQWNLPLFGA